jgi:hypothetical protein
VLLEQIIEGRYGPGTPLIQRALADEYVIPGIIVQNIAFGGFVTALGLNEDVHKGLIDRFRSLPMARPAVLAGRTIFDIVTNALSLMTLLITSVIIGFTSQTSPLKSIGGVGLLLLFGFAFSWFFAFVGLLTSTPSPRTPSPSSWFPV